MICEDDENVSEPEMVTHEDVQPDKKDVAPEVTSQNVAATPEVTSSNVAPAAKEIVTPKPETSQTEKLAEDLSQARLSDKKEDEVKVVKRNDVVTPSSVVTPPNVVSPTSKTSTDEDDDRPQPPDDDSVPDEDSSVSISFSWLKMYFSYFRKKWNFYFSSYKTLEKVTI